MESYDPLQDTDLTFLFGMSFQLLHSKFVERLHNLGYAELRPIHGMTFQALRGEGATSTELAEHLGVTKQAAGQIVDYLEERGYVRRKPHPDGGRRRLVVLTDKALTHLTVAGRMVYELEAELAEKVDIDLPRLRRELATVIRQLADGPIPPLRPLW